MLYTAVVGLALAFTAPPSLVQQSVAQARFSSPVMAGLDPNRALGWNKKKNPKTGDTARLMGYKVGQRAPDGSKSSGTTKGEQKAWDAVAGFFQNNGLLQRTSAWDIKAKNKEATGSTNALKGYKVGMRDANGYGAGIGGELKKKTKRI